MDALQALNHSTCIQRTVRRCGLRALKADEWHSSASTKLSQTEHLARWEWVVNWVWRDDLMSGQERQMQTKVVSGHHKRDSYAACCSCGARCKNDKANYHDDASCAEWHAAHLVSLRQPESVEKPAPGKLDGLEQECRRIARECTDEEVSLGALRDCIADRFAAFIRTRIAAATMDEHKSHIEFESELYATM